MEKLENDHLVITVNPIGAELSGIYSKSNQKQYLWQGHPQIWESQAPVLFPIIGGLKDGFYLHDKKKFKLPKHGFIRYNSDLKLDLREDHKIRYAYRSSEETKKSYPFDFEFTITFELVENEILVSHRVKNMGDQVMYFSVGGHPAFNCPLHNSESCEEYYIQLQNGSNTLSYILNNSGTITNRTKAVMKENKIYLNVNLFDEDALIFKDINAEKATLVHKEKGEVLAVSFSDFPDLGIWAKPNASFVCIEPWLGYADLENSNQVLAEKEGIQSLNPGKIHHSSYTISIY